MRVKLKWPVHLSHLAIGVAGLVVLLYSGRAAGQLPGGLHDVPALRAAVERFAGAAARLDARLVVPRCPAPALSWARADVVRADCSDPAWTLYVPVAVPARVAAVAGPAARPRPAVRRGDRVAVEAIGPGFVIVMEAEAERDADGARVALKGPAGRRFTARIEEGGRLVLAR